MEARKGLLGYINHLYDQFIKGKAGNGAKNKQKVVGKELR